MTVTQKNTVRRGRPAIFADKFAIVDLLVAVRDGTADKNRYLLNKLVNEGFLVTNPVKGTGRGRPTLAYELTGKARSRIALAKTWKRG